MCWFCESGAIRLTLHPLFRSLCPSCLATGGTNFPNIPHDRLAPRDFFTPPYEDPDAQGADLHNRSSAVSNVAGLLSSLWPWSSVLLMALFRIVVEGASVVPEPQKLSFPKDTRLTGWEQTHSVPNWLLESCYLPFWRLQVMVWLGFCSG